MNKLATNPIEPLTESVHTRIADLGLATLICGNYVMMLSWAQLGPDPMMTAQFDDGLVTKLSFIVIGTF